MTAVYACVRILSEAIARLPVHLYNYQEDGSREKALKHSLYRLLHDAPNPEMTSFLFRETLMTHLLLWGNAYAQIIRNGKGEVIIDVYPHWTKGYTPQISRFGVAESKRDKFVSLQGT